MTSPHMDAAERPTFSVIVPTYNRPAHLAACLESLAALHFSPSLFEVIVVDDGGRRSLDAAVASVRPRLSVTVLRVAHAGPGAARNAGAARARGRFLAFTDDDCLPAPGWLHALAGHLEGTAHAVVGGPMDNALPGNVYAAASHALMEAVDAYFNIDSAQARTLFSGNLGLSRADFLATGGFDATLMTSEDRDFCDRCLEHGYRLVFAEDAAVEHVRPLTLRTFWRQHFEYGRGTFDYHRRRASRGSAPVRFEAAFHLHVLRYPFGRRRWLRALALSGLLVVSLAAKAAGLLWQWIRSRGPVVAREEGADEGLA